LSGAVFGTRNRCRRLHIGPLSGFPLHLREQPRGRSGRTRKRTRGPIDARRGFVCRAGIQVPAPVTRPTPAIAVALNGGR
jgi:hypothetical protein